MTDMIFRRRCGNCAHWHMKDKWCHSDLPADAIACKNWDPEPQLREEITERTQAFLAVKNKSWARGYTFAELDLMCEAACQLMPNSRTRFLKLRDDLQVALKEQWQKEDTKK